MDVGGWCALKTLAAAAVISALGDRRSSPSHVGQLPCRSPSSLLLENFLRETSSQGSLCIVREARAECVCSVRALHAACR